MSIKLTIIEQMEQVAREHGKILAPLKEDLMLADCGLDSLGFAVLLARLEALFGIDPFSAADEARRFRESLRAWPALTRRRCARSWDGTQRCSRLCDEAEPA